MKKFLKDKLGGLNHKATETLDPLNKRKETF